MDAASQFTARSLEAVTDIDSTTRREPGRTLNVTASFRLSEEGRKASLVAGGDGRALQEITLPVPTNRFHLVSVDPDGVATLKLQPRYYLDANQNVVRDDAAPTYDAPPAIDDLLKEAARNHQLERAYQSERAESRNKRLESQFEAHQKLAEQFLADPTMRALEHPKPTPRQCYLAAGRRPMQFDAKQHQGLARQVPPEAYRRFSEDLRARTERNREIRARELGVHGEKQRLIADWVAKRGTPAQKERHAAGVLAVDDVLEGMADDAFAAVGNRPRYVRDGVERLQAHLRQFPEHADTVVSKANLLVTSINAEEATEVQWALRCELQALLPEAELTLRLHRLSLKTAPNAPHVTQFGVLAMLRVGPFTLRREYLTA